MASSSLQPIPVQSRPGIRRDGTQFDGDYYIDGKWCRFQRGKPRKMGGYQSITSTLAEKIYGMRVDAVDQSLYAHLGSGSFLIQNVLNSSGVYLSGNDRTPAAFGASTNNLWQLDSFYDSAAGTQQLIAHAGQNLNSIANQTEFPIYAGAMDGTGPLVDTGMDPVSGGVVSVWPYLMAYGTNGRVDWTAANDFSATLDSAFVAGSKIVKGLPLRGTGTGPGAILWSLDSVIRAQFNDPTSSIFGFDTISSESSVLSSQGFVDYDGIFYWVGMDRFMMFNGVVREVPNDMNINWFFDNLNFVQRQKVFAYKVPRFGEIWWCFPYGNATECTHAVILNVREGYWYDTELPPSMRTAGAFAKVFQRPFMCDGQLNSVTNQYTFWQQEIGTDEVFDGRPNAILSRFRTKEFSLIADAGQDMGFSISRTEPDFVQSGALILRVHGRANARAPDQPSADFSIPEVPDPATPQEQVVNLKESRRIFSLEFESNVSGGNYQMGKVLGYVQPQDMRFTGA